MAAVVGSGKCILGCGRACPTHSITNICPTCLNNLSGWRRKSPAARMRYRATLTVRQARQMEIDKHPKGYRLGRPKPTKGKLT